MDKYSWSVDSAIYQIKNGEKSDARTEDADGWLYSYIAGQAQAGHALTVAAIAEKLMDALRG